MSYQLVFTDSYNRRALRFLKRHPQPKAPLRQDAGAARSEPAPPFPASARGVKPTERIGGHHDLVGISDESKKTW